MTLLQRSLLQVLRESFDTSRPLTLRAPVVHTSHPPLSLRMECGTAAVRGFGLQPNTRLPIVFSGARFYLSGVKRPGKPWELRLRGRIGG
jgi:hypothetical protein